LSTAARVKVARTLTLLCGALALLGGCRQAAPSLERTTAGLSSGGGQLSLPGGYTATFSEGFFTAPAAAPVEVTLLLSETSEPYPAEIAAAYPPGSSEPMAPNVSVRFPSHALGTRGELALRVPAALPPLEGEERLLAEVQLTLADGERHFFFEQYARVESPYGQLSEGTDTVTLSAAQLRPLGAARLSEVRVSVRPVRLSNSQLAPQSLPSGFALEEVVGGLNQGVAFDFSADGRIFIAEKGGVVRVVENGRLRPGPFIDLSREVNAYNARGLLGFALHPNFPQQPYAYLLYTYDPPEVHSRTGFAGPDNAGARVARLVRVTADAAQGHNVALSGSARILLGSNSTFATIGDPAARNSTRPSCGALGSPLPDCIPSDEISHTIGGLRFAPDGALFVSIGDGSDFTKVRDYVLRAQELDSLAGKLLRINPETGQGYRDNPFYNGDLSSNRSKVFNYGMRNPFRFTVHPQTGVPYIGDVGWNTWEEVNSGRGQNFGWPCFEGGSGRSLQQGGYRALSGCAALYSSAAPVASALYAYTHGSGASSVQVGDFYLGERYPAAYRGALFVNDFNQGLIRTVSLTPAGALAGVANFMTEPGVVQIRAGPAGDLYLINIYDGKLKRLRYTAADTAPLKAVASGTPLEGPAPLSVQFSSAGSSGAGALSYSWDFGNGTGSSEANPSAVFSAPGSYPVTLQVTDAGGETSRSSVNVRVGNTLPTLTITSPAPGTRYQVGRAVPFSGSASDAEDGALPEDALTWTLNTRHNDHVHSDGLPPTTGSVGSFVPQDHGDNTSLELCLSARDSLGGRATSCVLLPPETVAYTLDTVPTGLTLPWEGVARRTPFTVTTIVGGTQQLIAPAQQGAYTFSGWSDGGAALHEITVGGAPTRFVASYTAAAPTMATYTVNLTSATVPVGRVITSVSLGRGVGSSTGRTTSHVGIFAKRSGLSGNMAMVVGTAKHLLISRGSGSQTSYARGGYLDFRFDTFGPTGRVEAKTLLIKNTTTTGGTVRIYRGTTLLKTVSVPRTGSGVSRTLSLNVPNASLVKVTLTGPGAVDNLVFAAP
jgi:glucose/arabinose dehydrogenase